MNTKNLYHAVRRIDMVRIPERKRTGIILRAALMRLHVAGPNTHVYVRTSHGEPDAVTLMFNNMIPEPHHKHIEYIPALDYLEREAHETLASMSERE